MMRIGISFAALVIVVGAASSAAQDGVWMVGGAGPNGDCMAQFALRWDPRWSPTSADWSCKHPILGKGGVTDRIHKRQTCVDGDGCDRDTVDGQPSGSCTFEIWLCFGTDDPSSYSCRTEKRNEWCGPPTYDAAELNSPFAYLLYTPSRPRTDWEGRIRCQLEKAVRGCVLPPLDDYPTNDECCGDNSDQECSGAELCPTNGTVGKPSVLMPHVPWDDEMLSVFDSAVPVLGLPSSDVVTRLHLKRTNFVLIVDDRDGHHYTSPLHRRSDFGSGRAHEHNLNPVGLDAWQKQYVRWTAFDARDAYGIKLHSCTDVVPIVVPKGETIVLHNKWRTPNYQPEHETPLDKGGGHSLTLTCGDPYFDDETQAWLYDDQPAYECP